MKNKFKIGIKSLAVFMSLLFLLSAFSVQSFAASEKDYHAYIKLTSSKASPSAGESFTVTVSAKTDYPVINVNTIIVYDSKYYSLDTSKGAAVKLATSMPVSMNGSTSSPLGMYHQSYSSKMAKRYKLVFNSITWLPSLAPQGTSTPTTTLTEYTKLYTVKFKVKSNAPTDGKGFIGIDPVYLKTENSTMRSGIYAARGGETLKESAVATCGQTYDFSEATLFGGSIERMSADYTLKMDYKSTKDVSSLINSSNEYEWLSSDTSIVDTNGSVLSSKKTGTAYVAAISSDGSERYNVEVNVEYSLIQWIIIIFLFGWLWY